MTLRPLRDGWTADLPREVYRYENARTQKTRPNPLARLPADRARVVKQPRLDADTMHSLDPAPANRIDYCLTGGTFRPLDGNPDPREIATAAQLALPQFRILRNNAEVRGAKKRPESLQAPI
jgi:hypothetical protein